MTGDIPIDDLKTLIQATELLADAEDALRQIQKYSERYNEDGTATDKTVALKSVDVLTRKTLAKIKALGVSDG